MNDLDRLIFEAWERVGPWLKENPEELRRRIARRRRPSLTRPMRHWCLAIRASDRRITAAHWVISPEHAMDRDHPEHPYEPIEHEVIIRPHALRKYMRPVRLDDWGEEVGDLAKMLGCSVSAIDRMRREGLFSERGVRGLGGKHCRYPIPILHSQQRLDPSFGRFFAKPDSICGSLWECLADSVPDDFEQTVMRRPIFRDMRPWSGVRAPEDAQYRDEMRLIGWRWVCPGCKRPVRTIYYPVSISRPGFLDADIFLNKQERQQWQAFESSEPRLEDLSHPDLPARPPAVFACRRCHRVQDFYSTSEDGWNKLVGQLSGGLLYGSEVEKPEWFKPMRKRRRTRQLNRRAPRREQVLRRLLCGWSVGQIARDLMISGQAVDSSIRALCEQEDVADRHALAAKLGASKSPPLNGHERAAKRRFEVKELVLSGLSSKEIAKRLGVKVGLIGSDLMRLYRQHGIVGGGHLKRWRLAEKLGREMAASEHDLLREKIAGMLEGGMRNKEIAAELGMRRDMVSYYRGQMRRWGGTRRPVDCGKKGAATEAAPTAHTVI